MVMLKECKTQRRPKTICNSHDGTSKIARPRKRWRDKVQENIKVTKKKNRPTIVKDRREWRMTVLEAKDHGGPST